MRGFVAFVTCCAMVFHYTVADVSHAHGRIDAGFSVPHSHADDCHHDRDGSHERTPEESDSDPHETPADDFHEGHDAATLNAAVAFGLDAGDAALDGFDLPMSLCVNVSRAICENSRGWHTIAASLRAPFYQGLGAFLS